MNNHAFSKIWIIVIVLIIIAGGVLVYRHFVPTSEKLPVSEEGITPPSQPTGGFGGKAPGPSGTWIEPILPKQFTPEEIEEKTADWKIYSNERYDYSFKYPQECRYGPMLPTCKGWSPEEGPPSECQCYLAAGDLNSVGLSKFVKKDTNWINLTFDVNHYDTVYYNPPFGTNLISWLKEKWSIENVPDKPNMEIDGTPAVMAGDVDDIFVIKNGELFKIQGLGQGEEFLDLVLATFKFTH
jgi:hypothetical protein